MIRLNAAMPRKSTAFSRSPLDDQGAALRGYLAKPWGSYDSRSPVVPVAQEMAGEGTCLKGMLHARRA